MTVDGLCDSSALELGRRIRDGECTSRQVVEAHLARIEEVNSRVNAVTRVNGEEAVRRADDADLEIADGQVRGPLHGVPFTTKENIDRLGSPTTLGIVAMAEAMPAADAPIVERLLAAGAVPIARTNMPDFGLRVHTDNRLHGATLNPWDASLTCGGSSGGEGAAIATGMSPMGIGNDIGGSVRNPAYCSGVAAHKPTPHRLPRASSLPPTSPAPAGQYMSVEGPMARTVTDLRAMFAIMHGRDPRDPWSVTTPFRDEGDFTVARVAVLPEPAGGTTDPEISAGVRRAADALTSQGYEVEEVEPPDVEGAAAVWTAWLGAEVKVRRDLLDMVMSDDSIRFLDLVEDLVGPTGLAATIDAMTERHALARQWSEFFQKYTVLLGPSWAQPPFAVGHDIADVASARDVLEMLRLTVCANLLALPSTAVPIGIGSAGIPLGVQVMGEQHRDDVCLDVAATIERAFPPITPIDPR